MNARILITTALLLIGLCSSSQKILINNNRMGLVQDNGETILPYEYRSIVEVDQQDKVFLCQTPTDKFGLYFYKTGYMLPCDYDEIQYDRPVYLLRSAKQWGWLVPDKETGVPLIEAPAYPILEELTVGYYLIKRDSLYGVADRDMQMQLMIPMKYPKPIRYYNEKKLFITGRSGEEISLFRGSKPGECLEFPGDPFKLGHDEYFIYYYTEEPLTLKMIDAKTGLELPSYVLDWDHGKHVIYHDDWRCVVESQRISWRKRDITLINPNNGDRFYSRRLKGNEELRMEGFSGARNLYFPMTVLVYWHKHGSWYERFEGEIREYRYQAYEKPTYDTGTYIGGSSSGKKPWFMPGKD